MYHLIYRKSKTARLVLLICFLQILGALASADSAYGAKLRREKAIDFEDDVVEGLNKRPLDSLSQLNEGQRRKRKPHIYRVRRSFSEEALTTMRNLGRSL